MWRLETYSTKSEKKTAGYWIWNLETWKQGIDVKQLSNILRQKLFPQVFHTIFEMSWIINIFIFLSEQRFMQVVRLSGTFNHPTLTAFAEIIMLFKVLLKLQVWMFNIFTTVNGMFLI